MKRFFLNTVIEIKESAILLISYFHTASATELPKHPAFPYKYFRVPKLMFTFSPIRNSNLFVYNLFIYNYQDIGGRGKNHIISY